ncbi:MAG: hypothetical protein QOI07_1785 [Verrucomicrobiota bacterium]|jgi:hypothetical protein
MKTLSALVVFLLLGPLLFEARALTEAERQQAIEENTADLKAAVDNGDLEAATVALEALKNLKQAAESAQKSNDIDDPKKPQNIDDVFKTLRDWGLSLTLAPDADGGKGAHFGFNHDRHAGTDIVWDAQFYLKWNLLKRWLQQRHEPVLYLGDLRVDSLAVSAQGKITSTDNTATDAWRFRLESETYLRLDRSPDGVLRGLLINLAAKDESNRDFQMNRFSGEIWITPIASRLYIGRFSGRPEDWIQFRWRPYVGIDAGRTDSESHGMDDSNVWLMARGKVELALNFLRNALHVKDVVLSAEDRIVYLSETSTSHNYLKANLSLLLTKSIGFSLDYSIGKDSPAFQSERILTGGLSVKF